MSQPVCKVDQKIKAALDETYLPYVLVPGKRHIKMMLNGKFIGVVSYSSRIGARDIPNTVARIRKAARDQGSN